MRSSARSLARTQAWHEKRAAQDVQDLPSARRARVHQVDPVAAALERGLHWDCQLDPPLTLEAVARAVAHNYYLVQGPPRVTITFSLRTEEDWEVYLDGRVEERGLVVESAFAIPERVSQRLRLAANCLEYGNPGQASAELSAAAFFCFQGQRLPEALRLASKALELNPDNSVARQSLSALEAKGVPALALPLLEAIIGRLYRQR